MSDHAIDDPGVHLVPDEFGLSYTFRWHQVDGWVRHYVLDRVEVFRRTEWSSAAALPVRTDPEWVATAAVRMGWLRRKRLELTP